MRRRIAERLRRLSLAQQFTVASLVILVAGMVGIGGWVGRQIEAGVVHRTAATTALYVDSFVAPNVQELSQSATLSAEHRAELERLLRDTSLGQEISAFKLWSAEGRILYSDDPLLVRQVYPIDQDLERAFNGEVEGAISDLDKAENVRERADQSQLLEMYSPVRLAGTNRVIAVAEFYQQVDDLQQEIAAARWRSWLIVGGATLLMYVLLAGFVQRASNTIARQQTALSAQIGWLTDLLAQNQRLHERVRRAAAHTAATNERFLRRISAELHDGPLQDLSLAILRLDLVSANEAAGAAQLEVVQESLQRALQEVRVISAGLGLPELSELTIGETIARVVRAHERRTQTSVTLIHDDLPDDAPLPVKITLYRMIQEALTNAARHADGRGQQVRVRYDEGQLEIVVADQGPGFDQARSDDARDHLGLIGMRERVESLGGRFSVITERGAGTQIVARLPLEAMEETYV